MEWVALTAWLNHWIKKGLDKWGWINNKLDSAGERILLNF